MADQVIQIKDGSDNAFPKGSISIAALGNGSSGITHYGYVVKDVSTKSCRIFIVARSSSNISTTMVLATVPSGYRPAQNASLFGAVAAADGLMNAFYGTVKTDGSITQGAGSTIREVFLIGEYLCE